MKKIMLMCSALFCVLLTQMVFAFDKPYLCRVSGLKYAYASVIFFSQHTASPRLYAIHNMTHDTIWLTHERKHPSASAGWSSELAPGRWSAILVTGRKFDLQCNIQTRSGKMMMMPCERMVWVCQYSDFDSKNPIGGGYWVAENLMYHELSAHITKRGFVLPADANRSASHQ